MISLGKRAALLIGVAAVVAVGCGDDEDSGDNGSQAAQGGGEIVYSLPTPPSLLF